MKTNKTTYKNIQKHKEPLKNKQQPNTYIINPYALIKYSVTETDIQNMWIATYKTIKNYSFNYNTNFDLKITDNYLNYMIKNNIIKNNNLQTFILIVFLKYKYLNHFLYQYHMLYPRQYFLYLNQYQDYLIIIQ